MVILGETRMMRGRRLFDKILPDFWSFPIREGLKLDKFGKQREIRRLSLFLLSGHERDSAFFPFPALKTCCFVFF